MSVEYKCVAFPSVIAINNNHPFEEHLSAYQAKMNELAEDGWEFVAVDSLGTVETPGCIPSLLGAKANTISHKFLIFGRG